MVLWRMSALQLASAFPVSWHRPLWTQKKPASLNFLQLFKQQSVHILRRPRLLSQQAREIPVLLPAAPQATGKAARLLPDDKLGIPVPIDNSFPWEGGESQRSLLLLDGNAVLYRAYFKIMAKVHYGGLKDMGSEADWVLTVFTALSTIIRLLEIKPTHVAAAFDYKGFTFRHELYKPYKSGRPPTPDTVCQALECLKPALLAMGICVLEVPGVEADDVIATVALRAVDVGMNVSIASPDKDFFQIISPQLRLLRFVPRGSGIVAFGVKEFQERFGDIQPVQHLDVLALMGDKVDSIPGLNGVGEITALKLIKEFGSLDNVLANKEKVKPKRAREGLLEDEGGVLLSKKLLTLRHDLSAYMLPYTLDDLVCQNPKDNGDQFVKLMEAMAPYVDPSIPEDVQDRARQLWERWAKVPDAI